MTHETVVLTTPTLQTIIVWICATTSLVLLIPIIYWLRVAQDRWAKRICTEKEKEYASSGAPKLAELWRWNDSAVLSTYGAIATGIIERVVFAVAAYFWMPGLLIAAVAWIALKMLPGWTAFAQQTQGYGFAKMIAFCRLRISFTSVCLGLATGLVARIAVFHIASSQP